MSIIKNAMIGIFALLVVLGLSKISQAAHIDNLSCKNTEDSSISVLVTLNGLNSTFTLIGGNGESGVFHVVNSTEEPIKSFNVGKGNTVPYLHYMVVSKEGIILNIYSMPKGAFIRMSSTESNKYGDYSCIRYSPLQI